MAIVWRQGDIVAPEQAIELELLRPEQAETHRVVTISHSCDIARSEISEPEVELLVARIVSEADANARNGHGIRKLNIPAIGPQRTEWLELDIYQKVSVEKTRLLAGQPWDQVATPTTERGILRRWLAQRYSRSEFPNAFVEWFEDSGVGRQFERLAKRYSNALVGIYFDLDDDVERQDPDQPYAVGVYLVYDTANNENGGHAAIAAEELTRVFKACCQCETGWRWFELLYCEAASDGVFTLRAANEFRRWRFEHRSIAGEPLDASD